MTNIIDTPLRTITLLVGFLFLTVSGAFAQITCTNPVALATTITLNTTCGNSTGGINLFVDGGNLFYNFQWTPNVSNTFIASNLAANSYKIRIIRTSEPQCFLDTILIVNNSNGPAVEVVSITPTNCLASNGKVVLSPANLNYSWSNGETGAVNEGLSGGCYIVTATSPGSGCYRILRVCVPNENPLETSATILQQAKCDKPTGEAQINVSGGSGAYSYSLGNASHISGLQPGNYVCGVVDNTTGCKDSVTFSIENQAVTADVTLTPHNAGCAGANDGSLVFSVMPGLNFKLPFTAIIHDANGTVFPQDALPKGQYFLSITDADGCVLPDKSFSIGDPPPLDAQTVIISESCTSGGSILLNLTGGNGSYTLDWNDLPGTINPEDRINLWAGIYSATVYDQLQCAYPIGPFLVPSICKKAAITHLILPVTTTETYCMIPPVGVPQNGVTYSLLDGGSTGASAFGTWVLQSNACLAYSAGNTPGFAVDTVCILRTVNSPGLSDTLCLVVSITSIPLTIENVYFTVQANGAGSACGTIPANFNNPVLVPIGQAGLSGISGQYGTYTIASSACLTFQAGNVTGYNVDKICVGAYDNVLHRAHIICYWPTILPQNGCTGNIVSQENLQLATTNCDQPATVCIDIPYSEINNYALLEDGGPYTGGSAACDFDTLTAYSVSLLPLGGPYQLTDWQINGQHYTGTFSNLAGLLTLMNQIDPDPGWTVKDNFYILGGNLTNTYGPLFVNSAQGSAGTLVPGLQFIPQGSELRFFAGDHSMVFRNVLTGCPDSMQVQVICFDCPAIHNYAADASGKISWDAGSCTSDTLFCTNIPIDGVGQFVVTDNGIQISNFEPCGGFAAMRLDTGIHQILINNVLSTCQYNFEFRLNCGQPQELRAVPDQSAVLKNTGLSIPVLANDIVLGVAGNTSGLNGVALLDTPVHGSASYDALNKVIFYVPEDGFCGADSFHYRITDIYDQQSSTVVKITVYCDKILVFNAISPNGDHLNDDWQILGIELYPENEVRVFNRWGNLVYQETAYDNQNAWKGDWNGRDLPDGTYFYQISLGQGQEPLSGYLQIMR